MKVESRTERDLLSLFAYTQTTDLRLDHIRRIIGDFSEPELIAVIEDMRRRRLIFFSSRKDSDTLRDFGVTASGYDYWESIGGQF